MKRKMFATIGMCAILGITNILPVTASEKVESSLLQETIENLEEGYSEYYDILDTETTLSSSQEVNGEIENLYLLEMSVVLKADSVEEIDYYQGVTEYCDEISAKLEEDQTVEGQIRANLLEAEQENIYKELEQYIGEEKKLAFYVKETYPIDNVLEKEILFENGMEYVSWEEMVPAKHMELQENGHAAMEDIDMEYAAMIENNFVQVASVHYSYSVTDAVTYMRRYTSNPSTCSVCKTSCTSRANTAKYNSAYKNYASSHSDCANYISQALAEGGIPEDNTWKPESLAWVNVGELTTYMTNNGYWTSVSYNTVQKGDIIKFNGISHLAMVTYFDGTTYGYSAHTRDRLDCAYTITSKDKYYRVG